MDDDTLARIGRAYRSAKTRADRLHAELKDEVVAAYRRGEKTMDIARRCGQDRELVRRIRKAAEDDGRLPVRVTNA
ncbi:hypothetical protein [Umezawaea tangerina]|uniref:Homeodomain-like domain-containing protein n=1 Tax=Umezawaea tangerina TaxID=84725 RepID=A0A2T0SPF8_9PSEU|nr:hypothetical protein [Umezawaea tangerina]PRY35294.1 hypothetical protein CLV43_114212 [Umezawaea tangerina]